MNRDKKDDIRAVTPQEFEAYQRRTGGGGSGDNDPKTLREWIKSHFDSATGPMRNEAKAALRRHMDDDFNAGSEIKKIAAGGWQGFTAALKALKTYGPSQP